MAADVRRWGGLLPAHILQCGTHLGGVGGHGVHIRLLASGHHGHLQAGGHRRHLAGACLGLGIPALCAGQKVPDTGGLSPGWASAPSTPSPACAGGFARTPAAMRAVPKSRSRVFTLPTRRSRSLVMSADRDSAARVSSLALDRRASMSRLAASALIARASPTPARCSNSCYSTHSCTAPLSPRPAAGSARSTGVAIRGVFGGGGARCPLGGGGGFPLPGRGGGGGVVLPLDVKDVSPPIFRCLPRWSRMASHATSTHSGLRFSPPRDHIQPKDRSRGRRPLLPDPRLPRLHPPVPAHKPVGKQAHQLLPLGHVGTPHDHNGAGEGDAEGALHPPRLQDHVMGTTTSRGACPAPELASLWSPAERPERRQTSMRPLPASLGVRPPPVPPGGSPCSSGNQGRGLNRRRAWCRMSGDHA